MTEIEKENYNKYRWFLEQVEPYKGFEIDNYYGVQMMTVKRDCSYDLRLQYDYGDKHPQNGSAFKVETFIEAVEWMALMDSFKVDKTTTRKAKKYNPKEAKDYTKKKPLSDLEMAEDLKQGDW